MHKITRSAPRFFLLTWSMAALALTAFAQPTPAKSVPGGGPATSPANPTSMGPSAPMLSPMISGLISKEDYAKYSAFQQQLNDDPAIKELNAKISARMKELQQLQTEAHALREKLVAANPEIKAIRDKLMSAGHTRPGTGPIPLPAPAKKN